MSWDQTKFDAALEEYLKVTSRTAVDALNTKAYFIARKALWYTEKAKPSNIQGTLGRLVTTRHTTRSGRTVNRRGLELTAARDHDAPLAALIINKRRGLAHKPGLSGRAMDAAIRELIQSRLRSIAFLKSGWLTAIRLLANFVPSKQGEPVVDTAARQYGNPKGEAQAAVHGQTLAVAIIINGAIARHDKKDALTTFGARALDLAFYDETQSMLQYIEDKLKKDTEKANRALA
jgi:hypothetical protein